MDRLRILLAEDEALIAMYLAEMLTEMGHEVCGTEATQRGLVAAAMLLKPDLMIVDARLGEGSGVLAVEEILAGHFIPHVFASGDRRALRKLEVGSVVIEKPFLEAQLASAIARAIAARPITSATSTRSVTREA
jgi:CheY-like chemotaxis protein